MWEVTMVAAGASVQDLLWDSAGGVVRGAGVPGAFCMCTLPPTLLPACTLAAGPCSPA